MAEANDVSLVTLKGGAAAEKFDYLLGQVLENIDDPNTEADAERSITLTVKLKPSEDRDQVVYSVQCKAKLAPPKSDGGQMFVGRRQGALVAVEYDPTQRDMFDPERGEGIVPISRTKEEGGAS